MVQKANDVYRRYDVCDYLSDYGKKYNDSERDELAEKRLLCKMQDICTPHGTQHPATAVTMLNTSPPTPEAMLRTTETRSNAIRDTPKPQSYCGFFVLGLRVCLYSTLVEMHLLLRSPDDHYLCPIELFIPRRGSRCGE